MRSINPIVANALAANGGIVRNAALTDDEQRELAQVKKVVTEAVAKQDAKGRSIAKRINAFHDMMKKAFDEYSAINDAIEAWNREAGAQRQRIRKTASANIWRDESVWDELNKLGRDAPWKREVRRVSGPMPSRISDLDNGLEI